MITGFFPGAPYGDPGHSVLASAGGVFAPVVASGLVNIAISYFGSESTIPVYDKLDVVRITASFTDALTDVLTDPAARIFRLRTPDGVMSTATVPLQQSTGVWYVDLTASQIGNYRFRWEATGGAEDGQFVVQGTMVH